MTSTYTKGDARANGRRAALKWKAHQRRFRTDDRYQAPAIERYLDRQALNQLEAQRRAEDLGR